MKNVLKMYLRIFLEFFFSKKPSDFKKIPIIINNYNRLSTLEKLITDLKTRGYYNIYIIDNKSNYQPLLEFYKTTDCKVFKLNKNLGFKSLWKSKLWYKFMFKNYCYTDSDLSLVKECPDDFLEYFYTFLKKYPKVHKIGFSLKIDDLPNFYNQKEEVISWEKQFYKVEKEPNIYVAPIDTTFALYRPFSKIGRRCGKDQILRVGFPYQCHHMPWYVDSSNLSYEEDYYIKSLKTKTHWSELQKPN